MNATQRPGKTRIALLSCFLAILHAGYAAEVLPADQPVITSLALMGTNLVFSATFPAGVDRAALELRPTLETAWQESAVLAVPTNGGSLEFSIPQPALETAFFRLNVTLRTTAQTEQSSEVRYVVAPPLDEISSNGTPTEAVFHFTGEVDGSDRIVIKRQGAFWEHVHWRWPGKVTVNTSEWHPMEKNFLTSTGAVSFLPERYSLAAVKLEVIQGRDIIALERGNDALIVYLDDTPSGAAPYEFKLHFHPAAASVSHLRASTAATLKISAQIDGSDRLKITARDATWTHLARSRPAAVKLNDVPWDVNRINALLNAGTNAFLPSGIDFSTARIVHRSGRDLATLWADDDAVWVTFADNPNGWDTYELEIAFGQTKSWQ